MCHAQPYVLPSVKEAEMKVINGNMDKEYAGITGVPAFTKAAARSSADHR